MRFLLRPPTLRYCLVVAVLLPEIGGAQITGVQPFRRLSRASNFEFTLQNNGMLFGDPWVLGQQDDGHWPRGSWHMVGIPQGKGLAFLAQRNGKLLSSEAGFMRRWTYGIGVFDQMVPGRVGDPRAGYDPEFNGFGWRFVDDPDYVVYSSLDYDSTGTDVSGNNFNDWPIRIVGGRRQYIADRLDRRLYPPSYLSDEDMFCVFKDTDIRADPIYTGSDGTSIPIGLEIHNYVYSWGQGPLKDVVLFQYRIINKGGTFLDSCYVVFASSVGYFVPPYTFPGLRHTTGQYHNESSRSLVYMRALGGDQGPFIWTATPFPPTLGYPLLETPTGYNGVPVGLHFMTTADSLTLDYFDETGWHSMSGAPSDSIVYRNLIQPHRPQHPVGQDYHLPPVLLSGPFPLASGDTARYTVGYIFADSLPHLLLLDDLIHRMWDRNLQRPTPPLSPQLYAKSLNRAVKLWWDRSAESSSDPIVPDSLGAPFHGYRLLRSSTQHGPFVQIGQWTLDSSLVHEYIDRGEDIPGGLRNNVRYYYRLVAFDAGAARLKLAPMESASVDGINAVSVVPATDATDVSSTPSSGALVSGTLGDVSLPNLVPIEPTNFNALLSGHMIRISLGATTDGLRYTLPVTIRDTATGRAMNAVIDPNLLVHGSPAIAALRQAVAVIPDLFGLGAANLEFPYRFEQLAEPYHIAATIEGQADVPVVCSDSLNYTGIVPNPHTSAAREVMVEFVIGGIDTLGILFQRFIPYLNIRVVDADSGNLLQPNSDYTWSSIGLFSGGGGGPFPLRPNRYYLGGMLSNGEQWDCGHTLAMYGSRVAFDFRDHGVGSGKPAPTFPWASSHRTGTRDFQTGDRVRLTWRGGVKATFPRNAEIVLTGAGSGRTTINSQIMDRVRIVPNPYIVRHAAQREQPALYFNYLPEECTIRIYTLALDLVAVIDHRGGSREEWNLRTSDGQLVASQVFVARIDAANGASTVKKFAVVVGK
jgi:hypothetical protein